MPLPLRKSLVGVQVDGRVLRWVSVADSIESNLWMASPLSVMRQIQRMTTPSPSLWRIWRKARVYRAALRMAMAMRDQAPSGGVRAVGRAAADWRVDWVALFGVAASEGGMSRADVLAMPVNVLPVLTAYWQHRATTRVLDQIAASGNGDEAKLKNARRTPWVAMVERQIAEVKPAAQASRHGFDEAAAIKAANAQLDKIVQSFKAGKVDHG